MSTICLNMIVKNEALVIERCLKSVRPFIDSWVIVDTGSTDGTQDIIRNCLEDLPGELFERPWKNFGHNRSEAIELAGKRADYLFIMDADDELIVPVDFQRPALDADSYSMEIEHGSMRHWRASLLSTRHDWRYVGVLHEYPAAETAKTQERLAGPRILIHSDGARGKGKSESEKYLADARILEQGLKDEPENTRYAFYLAQSYRDAGQLEKSVKAYQRRSKMGGWEEEVWHSLFEVANLSERLGLDSEVVIQRFLNAYQARPARAEPLVQLARFYREKGQFSLAHLFAEKALKIPRPDDTLFLDASAYDWRARDEYAVACYWIGQYRECAKACEQLLKTSSVPHGHLARITDNLNFARKAMGQAVALPAFKPAPEPQQVDAPGPAQEMAAIVTALLKLPHEALRVTDIGAGFFGQAPPYQPLLDQNLCQLFAFEPDEREIANLRQHLGTRATVLPFAVGDGAEHTLYICPKGLGMSSLLEPDPSTLGYFSMFPEWGRVVETTKIATRRLDDIGELPQIDFLKMDVQGSELPILQNGRKKLARCVAVQTEISFITLYKNQAPFGEIDRELRVQGFIPHRFTDVKCWSIAPTVRGGEPRWPFNQLLEGDIVYIRDIIHPEGMDNAQIAKLAVIAHFVYNSPDLAARCLDELAKRNALDERTPVKYRAALKEMQGR